MSSMPLERICTVQPLGVSQNAVFLVDIDVINFGDLKADDLGLWKGTGIKKTYFKVLASGAIRYPQCKPNLSESIDTINSPILCSQELFSVSQDDCRCPK